MRNLHVSAREIEKQSQQIFSVVNYGESGIGVCYPGCLIDYNLSCYLDRPAVLKSVLGKYYKRFLFIPIYVTEATTPVSLLEDMRSYVKKEHVLFSPDSNLAELCKSIIDAGRDPYFFLFNCQSTSSKMLGKILDPLHQLIVNTPRVGALLFFEANIYRPDLKKLLQTYRKFTTSISYFPVYSYEESLIFLKNLADDWKLRVAETLQQEIAKTCGGSLCLMREALRHVRNDGEKDVQVIITKPGIKFRMQTFFDRLTDEEKRELAEICTGRMTNLSEANKEYFISTGVVEKKGSVYKITLPLFEKLFALLTAKQTLSLDVQKDVYYKDKNINLLFGQNELKALQHLLERRNQLVTREELAKVVWGESYLDYYSDWALDKLISRIRITLNRIGLPKETIVIKKRRGIILI